MSFVSIELMRFAEYQNDYANQGKIALAYVESDRISIGSLSDALFEFI